MRKESPRQKRGIICCIRQGILKDDLSNETLAYGLHAWKQDGSMHEGIEGFLREQEPVRLTLRTLGKSAKSGTAKRNLCSRKSGRVFRSDKPEPSLCSSLRQRTAQACDFAFAGFSERKPQVWYAGDFDPEAFDCPEAERAIWRGAAFLEV